MTLYNLSVCKHDNSRRGRPIDVLVKLGVRILWVKVQVSFVDGLCSSISRGEG
jgi:hypothetical protein